MLMDFCIWKNCSNFAVTIRMMGIFTSVPSYRSVVSPFPIIGDISDRKGA